MKTIEQAAQECAEKLAQGDNNLVKSVRAAFTPIIAAAMREVCEPLERDLKQMGMVAAERLEWHTQSRRERDRLSAALAVAEGLLKVAKCPDPRCDGNGSSWYVAHTYAGEPEQVQVQCQWCDERQQALARIAELKKS